VSKKAALNAWGKLSPDPALQKAIHAALAKQTACDQWAKDDGKFIPHPSTWLNGHRWEDEVQTAGGNLEVLAAAFGRAEPPTSEELDALDPELFGATRNGHPGGAMS
jgi:hypothetical protein